MIEESLTKLLIGQLCLNIKVLVRKELMIKMVIIELLKKLRDIMDTMERPEQQAEVKEKLF